MSLDVSLYIEVDTGGPELYHCELYSANITHNLIEMAREAGIYKEVWCPEEIGIESAGDIIPALKKGIEDMSARPSHYETFDSSNGWGSYDNFLPWLERYLRACTQHPKAKISARQ